MDRIDVRTTDTAELRPYLSNENIKIAFHTLLLLLCAAATVVLCDKSLALYRQCARYWSDAKELRPLAGRQHDIAQTNLLDPELYWAASPEQQAVRMEGRTLLVFGTDDCESCIQATAVWARIAAQTKLPVRLVLPNERAKGELVAGRFMDAGVSAVVVTPREPELYGAVSGVASMPLAIAIVENRLVPCVLSGVPGESAARECVNHVRAPRNTYLFHGPDTRSWSHWLIQRPQVPGAQPR